MNSEDWYYSQMTNLELLNDSNNESLLDAYRLKCLQLLQARLESEQEVIEL